MAMRATTNVLDNVAMLGGVAVSEREFKLFQTLIYKHTGILLRDTKASMLSSRLSKRLRQLNLPSFHAYYELLQAQGPSGDEFRELTNNITTNKTAFFREKHHFEFLSKQLKQRKTSGPLRIWSSACSTGEEPYSLAMTIADAFGSLQGRDIRILASDIDTKVLQEAEAAVYEASLLRDIPPAMQSRYTEPEKTPHGPGFSIRKQLCDLVTFRQKNLISPSWAINIKFDFIFCRNVLIYFDHKTQDEILRRFITFLKPHAYLIIGHSEHVSWLSSLIEPVGQTIYRVKE